MRLKKFLKNVAIVACSATAICLASTAYNVKADTINGLGMDEFGNWHYYTDGQINRNYTGMASNEYGWWYVTNGDIDFSYTGMALNEYGWWYMTNGALDLNYTGMALNQYGWWYITNGALDLNYTGMALNDYGWWYMNNGALDLGYTGMAVNNYGWWYMTNGVVDFGYTGMAVNDFGWWYMTNGALDLGYTGMAFNDYGWWYMTNGAIDWNYTGMALNPYGWWYMTNGALDLKYTGMASNEYGWWYITNGALDLGFTGIGYNEFGAWYYTNGQINTGYTGQVTVQGVQYNVVNGFATLITSDDVYTVGAKQTGKLTGGVYMIQSTADRNYVLTATGDASNVNLSMQKATGENNQKFLVVYDEGTDTYCFLSLAYMTGNNDGNYLINSTHYGWGTDQKTDNIQVTADSVEGAKNWKIVESGSGDYTITVPRDDDNVFAMTADIANSNALTTVSNGDATQKFSFVSPYSNTLENGTYEISNGDFAVGIAGDSIKDEALLVLQNKTYGSEQQYNITSVDKNKGIYRIQNVNSERYLDNSGDVTTGTPIKQNMYIDGYEDQLWYIQKNIDGTYSFIAVHGNQYLTTSANSENAKLVQDVGVVNMASQRFSVTPSYTGNGEVATGYYKMGDKNYRFNSLGNGVYSIYSVSAGGYITGEGNVAADDTSALAKWNVEGAGSVVAVSPVTGKYLTSEGSVSSSKQTVSLSKRDGSYASRYDLSALNNATKDGNLQVVSRMNTLGLTRDELLDPDTAMAELSNKLDTVLALPTQEVVYTGNDVDDLNKFMKNNTGKVVKLQNDIQVYKNMSDGGAQGTIMIPSNVVLDGNGHSLVLKSGEAPDNAVVFYYYNGSQQLKSSNAGVKNLNTSIAYQSDVNLFGASNILVQNNTFANSTKASIVTNDVDGVAKNVLILNNTINNSGDDGIAVYGNNSDFRIMGNTITGCQGRAGIMISCLKEGQQMRVDQETTGPHDMLVQDNVISDCTVGEALYCIGTYRVYMTGNTLKNSFLEGVCMDSGCIGNYFANNEVYNNGLSGGLPGVSIDNGIYNVVDGNNVYDNTCSGIKLVRAGLGNIIVENTCTSNSKKTTDAAGKTSSSAGIDIEPLKVDAQDGDTLDGKGSNGNVVMNNTVTGSHDFGVYVAEDSQTGTSSGNSIKYNVLNANLYRVIDYSTSNNTILYNYSK